jgi:hypothetical protein
LHRNTRIVASLALIAGLFAALPFGAMPDALADNHTISGDTMRTGWDSAQPNLSPATVTTTSTASTRSTAPSPGSAASARPGRPRPPAAPT